jgi:hypothetical protein
MAGDDEDEELTRDAFKDEEVVDRDVIHDSVEDDEEEV